jgi:hypothetical protein
VSDSIANALACRHKKEKWSGPGLRDVVICPQGQIIGAGGVLPPTAVYCWPRAPRLRYAADPSPQDGGEMIRGIPTTDSGAY